MDILGLDIEAIATLLGLVVALYISREWKEQKRTEVIAVETKEIIALLLKNQIILSHFKTEERLENVKVELDFIKDEFFNCLGRIRYLEMAITEDLDDLIKKLATAYLSLLHIADTQLENPSVSKDEQYFDKFKQDQGFTQFQQYIDDINTYSSEIIAQIYSYSVYKKYIKI